MGQAEARFRSFGANGADQIIRFRAFGASRAYRLRRTGVL